MNEIEELLLEMGAEGASCFTGPYYETALIGVTTDGAAVYDYELMVEYLVEHEGTTEEEARDWIDYNCVRGLPYMGDTPPVIVYPVVR